MIGVDSAGAGGKHVGRRRSGSTSLSPSPAPSILASLSVSPPVRLFLMALSLSLFFVSVSQSSPTWFQNASRGYAEKREQACRLCSHFLSEPPGLFRAILEPPWTQLGPQQGVKRIQDGAKKPQDGSKTTPQAQPKSVNRLAACVHIVFQSLRTFFG